ncbi:MAG TPA: hypothetical protein VGI19_19240 [Candidatus Cybelea sp.]|jgi:hypothetical protein
MRFEVPSVPISAWILFFVGATAGALLVLIVRSLWPRPFAKIHDKPGWIAAISAFLAMVASSYFSYGSNQAALEQLKLERSAILTLTCDAASDVALGDACDAR